MVCSGLSIHWRLNPQYSFGWFVPALLSTPRMAAGGRGRLPGAPVPLALASRRCSRRPSPDVVFSQPNPDWQALNWIFTAQAAAFTLAFLRRRAEPPGCAIFLRLVALIFTAVAWPDTFEAPLMREFMHLVAGASVALLDLAGCRPSSTAI